MDVQLSGREMPHSLETEAGLLACCFIDAQDIVSRCREKKLDSTGFYGQAHRIIFDAILTIVDLGSPVDIIVLCEAMKRDGTLDQVGGVSFVNALTNLVATTAMANRYIDILVEYAALRSMIRASTATVEQCFSYTLGTGIDEVIEKAEKDIFQVGQSRVSGAPIPLSKSIPVATEEIAKIIERGGVTGGISTGFKDIDSLLWGFHKSHMIVLAARPAVGKTSLAMNIAENVALPHKGDPAAVVIFSLEMSIGDLNHRLICSRGKVSSSRMRNGFCSIEEQQRIATAACDLKGSPIWIDDEAGQTIHEIRAKARRFHARQPLGLVVLDYLQLCSGDSKTQREQQVAEISRGLKAMAKELSVPVLVLSQLNRESERDHRQPKLSDLRESGAIEQDADVVMLLARPNESKDDIDDDPGYISLIIAKNRNGPVGVVKLTFQREITRFENYTP